MVSRLEQLAIEVAIAAPLHQQRYAFGAKIDWRIIDDLRQELDHRGVDWRAMCRREKEIRLAQRQRIEEERRA